MKRVWVAVLVLCGAWNARAEKVYSLADLEALQKAEGWAELVEHLADVAPSKRDAKWDAAAEAGATGLLGTLTDSSVALATSEDLVARFPTLKKSRTFMQKRNEAALPGFTACYRGYANQDCAKRLTAFVGDDGELALKAGKLVTMNQFPYFAVPFFRTAVTGKISGGPGCKEESLQRATVAALGLSPSDSKVADGQAILDACFSDLKEPVIDELATGNSYLMQNACAAMIKKQALGGLMKARCEAAAQKK